MYIRQFQCWFWKLAILIIYAIQAGMYRYSKKQRCDDYHDIYWTIYVRRWGYGVLLLCNVWYLGLSKVVGLYVLECQSKEAKESRTIKGVVLEGYSG